MSLSINTTQNALPYSTPLGAEAQNTPTLVGKNPEELMTRVGQQQASADGVLSAYNEAQALKTQEKNAKDTKTADSLVKTGTSAIGVGASVGAAIGSIFPGIGTVIGGAVGALIGVVVCTGCLIASAVIRPNKAELAEADAFSQATQTGAQSLQTLQTQSAQNGAQSPTAVATMMGSSMSSATPS